MCDVEDLTFDNDFVRNHLSFLFDSDKEDEKDSEESYCITSVQYFLTGKERITYKTSLMKSSVDLSWSSSSSGSISSVKENISNVVNICLQYKIHQPDKSNDPNATDSSNLCYNSFIVNFPTSKSSTPTYKPLPIKDLTFNKATPCKLGRAMRDLTLWSASEDELLELDSASAPYKLGREMRELTLRSASDDELVEPDSASALISETMDPDLNDCFFDDFDEIIFPDERGSSSTAANYCKFCWKNGEPEKFYKSHIVKKSDGIVICPVLRKYVCTLCGETGDHAHTRKYCPQYTERFRTKPVLRRLSNGILTSKQNYK